jgi:hypothetical protein
MVRRAVLSLTAVVVAAASAAACPFCPAQGQTLSGEVSLADLIVLGTLKNPKRDADDPSRGTTELHIESVVKTHEYLAGRKTIVLPRYVPLDAGGANSKFLVFCSVYPGTPQTLASAALSTATFGNFAGYTLDAYRGEPVAAGSKLPDYLKGSQAVRDKDAVAKLKYFFDYLDSPELIVASDAFLEFGNADYKDVRVVAETLPADKILKWLLDPNTPASRHGLYGLLLGHCGKKGDDALVKRLLDDPAKQFSSGLDGLMAGGILLSPKAGWDHLTTTVNAETNEFSVRYAGLRTIRFFWDYRPEVVTKAERLTVLRTLAGQADLADLPIEDLRKWGEFEQTGFVLSLNESAKHAEIPIVRRAILRFALSAANAGNKDAEAFVEKARKADPEKVKLVEDLLKDEKQAAGK